jgi:hypothetical protein
MTTLALVFGLLLPWVTGIGFLLALPRAFGPSPRTWPWAVLCALPLGLAMHVLLSSLLLILSPGWMHWGQVVIPELLLTAFTLHMGLRLYRQRSAARSLPPSSSPAPATPTLLVTKVVAGILTLAFFVGLYFLSTQLFSDGDLFPQGYFDAWHIWNFKARIIAEGQDSWRWYLLAPEAVMSHQEYPIGFSVLLARLYVVAGSFDPVLSKTVGLGVGLLCPLLVWAAVLRAKGYIHGACAGLLTLAFPFAIVQPAWQYADAPLGALLITTLAWHYFYCRRDDASPASAQTRIAWAGFGLLLGSLLWTKNEGLVMAGAIFGLCFLFDCFRKVGKTAIFTRYLAAGVPLALFAALHLYIKLNAHETTDLIKSHTLDKQVQGLIDFNRLIIIFKFFGDTFIHQIDRFSVLIALAALAFLGFDTRKSRIWPPALYTLALLAVSAAYCATFLFTPYDLNWHLGTAMSRLMIQLWPATVLILTLWTFPLDRVLATPLRFILNPNPKPPR